MVNAYEPHEQIYERLRAAPGTVLVRGGGIVASRVLQRLIDDRDRLRLQTQILHLLPHLHHRPHGPRILDAPHAAATAGPTRASTTRSRCGAGSSRRGCASSEGRARAELYKEIGGTNTPNRRNWQEQLAPRPRRRAGTGRVQGEIAP